jgi:hypothetical protein
LDKKLAFLSPAIPITSGKNPDRPPYGHSQPLINRRTIPLIPLLIALKITSDTGTGVGGITSSSLTYENLPLEVAQTLMNL